MVMAPPIIDNRNKQDSHRAKVRIGVAVALLVTAIVILTVLNQRRSEKTAEEPELPPAIEQPSLSSAEMEAPAAEPEELPAAAPSEAEETTAVEPPPPPVPGKLPETATAPAGKAVTTPAVEEESAGASPAQPYVASAVKTLSKPRMSATAVQSPAAPTQPSAPPLQSPPPKPLAPKVFEVQLGVFTDIDNAKQLQTKLAEHGIPSHTETRVQVGPFKTREEADRAREKLKKLGIGAVVLGK